MNYSNAHVLYFSEIRASLKADIENIRKDAPTFKPGLAIIQVKYYD